MFDSNLLPRDWGNPIKKVETAATGFFSEIENASSNAVKDIGKGAGFVYDTMYEPLKESPEGTITPQVASAPAQVQDLVNGPGDPLLVNIAFAGSGNSGDPMESAAIMQSIINRSARLTQQEGKQYTIPQTVNIKNSYAELNDKQYKNAVSGNLDYVSKQKYSKVNQSYSLINEAKKKIGDFDSFQTTPPADGSPYIKIGDTYFYKMKKTLRTE